MYSHLRTGKGDLQTWRFSIGKVDSPLCRFCSLVDETGDHIMFDCPQWENLLVKKLIGGVLRSWRSGEDGSVVDSVRGFLSQLDLR